MKNYLRIDGQLDAALDIACGTGLSTRALLPVAKNVFGTDGSAEMLKMALRNDGINYQEALAECQPFGNGMFDLITVCSGVHWFDIDQFLAECYRMLKPGAWLVLYENFFMGEMEDAIDFKLWNTEVYLKKFPSPPRNKNYAWTEDNLRERGFDLRHTENFANALQLSRHELVSYLITQSNVIARVENKECKYPAVTNWLNAQLSPFYDDTSQRRVLYYGNWIKYLQKPRN
ncbi:methyltransferase family protein [Mucilaginibacter yixingensis]|uniref:Methyltransferase family protein n=1 Tax=Mucilaginibacter yixingensis TaxID=1295612 RepID=A0A2T5J511_9SPHI|nr:class I SAM-dependent methyltransferase [Mucilaginibacter yixingensis]PTQ92873.1 methyltransferase family protein [Mucilaginibacter yixingensis]